MPHKVYLNCYLLITNICFTQSKSSCCSISPPPVSFRFVSGVSLAYITALTEIFSPNFQRQTTVLQNILYSLSLQLYLAPTPTRSKSGIHSHFKLALQFWNTLSLPLQLALASNLEFALATTLGLCLSTG